MNNNSPKKQKKIKVAIAGITGKMGRSLQQIINERDDIIISGALFSSKAKADDFKNNTKTKFVCSDDASIAFIDAQLIIDFSSINCLHHNVEIASQIGAPYLCGVTGLDKKDFDFFKICSNYIPILYESNFSIGVMVARELVKKAASLLDDNYDVEVLEYHHNQKVDAPSGTALLLGQEVYFGKNSKQSVYDDNNRQFHTKTNKKRDKNKIGFAAIRGGGIYGEHQVGFYSDLDSIEIIHKSRDRKLFASGAIVAGKKLISKKPGIYGLRDIISI